MLIDDRQPGQLPPNPPLEGLAGVAAMGVLCVAGGVAFGVLDRVLSHGPPWAFDLSNVASFWLAAAFAAGLVTRSRTVGAVLGLMALLGALGGYYGYMFEFEHVSSLRYLQWRASPWVVASLFVGPLFGALGTDWRVRRAHVAAMALAAAFCLDGLGYAILDGGRDVSNTVVHLGMVTIGLVIGVTLMPLRRRGIAPSPPGRQP